MIRTLVIDDEKAFTDVAVRIFSGLCQVDVAGTAQLGLAMAKELGPDIIVVDNQLPDRLGVDVVKQLRIQQDAFIVMITIDKQDEVAAALEPAKADVILKKPFRYADLEQAFVDAIRTVRNKQRTLI